MKEKIILEITTKDSEVLQSFLDDLKATKVLESYKIINKEVI